VSTYLPRPHAAGRRQLVAAGLLALAALLGLTLLAAQAEARKRHKPHTVKVMTRNLYLGSDLTAASTAPDPDTFCDEAGEILRDVTATNFPKRAKALAAEILKKKPDLVGLQEVALWRTDTPSDGFFASPALTVRYDFLKLLLNQLNKGPGSKYKTVIARNEFDFEGPANEDNVGSGCAASEIDGRLTMRDAILKRLKSGVKTTGATGGTFTNLYEANVSGFPIPILRGWVSTKARVRGSKRFKFVDTHLEAFDNGQTRRDQAAELVATGGPAAGKGRVILVGDLNSDPDDNGATKLAFNELIDAGFLSRTPESYTTSGINDELLVNGGPGDFTRNIDRILTNKKAIKRLSSSVFGKAKVNGLFPSDHAGVLAKLRIP
jgi:Endonuclease/Exonuclease/phosphatase family